MEIDIKNNYADFSLLEDNQVINEKVTDSDHDSSNLCLSSKDKYNNEINIKCFIKDIEKDDIEHQSNIKCFVEKGNKFENFKSNTKCFYTELDNDSKATNNEKTFFSSFYEKFSSKSRSNMNCGCAKK